ncbi:MAG: hypothetical protein GY953_49125 [bacterium]|nr:hypothetical protein [bacterium]
MAPLRRIPTRLVAAGVVLALLGHAVLYGDYFRDFREKTRDFTREVMPPGDRPMACSR